MVLSDRQAADMRANGAIGKAQQTLQSHLQANGANRVLAFRNGIREAVRELSQRLIEIYSQLDDASDKQIRDELVALITRLVTSFITSASAGQRGAHIASVKREAATQTATAAAEIPGSFDLAVYEHVKERQVVQAAAPATAAPARRKQDKFEILDSPKLFEPDFKQSVGVLGVSVIFFDLDDFKRLNTQFTEPVIDRTLLPELMRIVDALAYGRGFAYAEGGDEFIITLPNTNAELAEGFARVLLGQIRNAAFNVDGQPVRVTASAGIASSMSANDWQVCREEASAAKLMAKKQGKDQCVVSGSGVVQKSQSSLITSRHLPVTALPLPNCKTATGRQPLIFTFRTKPIDDYDVALSDMQTAINDSLVSYRAPSDYGRTSRLPLIVAWDRSGGEISDDSICWTTQVPTGATNVNEGMRFIVRTNGQIVFQRDSFQDLEIVFIDFSELIVDAFSLLLLARRVIGRVAESTSFDVEVTLSAPTVAEKVIANFNEKGPKVPYWNHAAEMRRREVSSKVRVRADPGAAAGMIVSDARTLINRIANNFFFSYVEGAASMMRVEEEELRVLAALLS